MIKLNSLEKMCIGCPSTWEGITDDGKSFYARYRYGKLKAELNNEIFYEKQVGNEYDGIMDTDEMVKHLEVEVSEELIKTNLIDWDKAEESLNKLLEI